MSFSVKISCQIFGMLAALLLNTVATQNCDKPIDENLKCFTEAGVKIDETEFRLAMKEAASGSSSSYLERMLNKDPGATCRINGEKEKLVKAYRCQTDYLGQCQASMRDFLPSVDKMSAYIDFYCQHEKEIDVGCVQSKTGKIQTCVTNKVTAYVQKHGSPSDTAGLRELMCESFTLGVMCQKTELRSCGNETMSIYTQINRDYLSPATCLGVAWVPSLFMTLLLAMVTARLF